MLHTYMYMYVCTSYILQAEADFPINGLCGRGRGVIRLCKYASNDYQNCQVVTVVKLVTETQMMDNLKL